MAQGIEAVAAAVIGSGVPAARRGVVRRALMSALDDVLDAGTGIVVGPRGSGKTTVLAQWATACGLPVVWARCTRAGISVRSGARAVTLTPTEVSGVLRSCAGPTLLVLDDVHELLGAGAAAELEQLLLTSAPSVHVVMGTRRQPTFTLARSEIDPPVVVTGADLRMRTWEVDRLFRDVYGHPLTTDDVETLTHETEGWAAAVHLFQRATDGLLPADRRRAVRSMRGDPYYARDYLVGEVLAELDRPLVELLHRGSVFDELTADRCDALTRAIGGADDAPPATRLLRELECTWSLASTEDGVHYRLPRVLHQHLRAAHAEHLGASARVWHDRAQAVLADEPPPRTAAGRAATWAEFDGIEELVDGHEWVGLVRAALRRDPAAQAEQARRLGGTGGALAEGLCLLLAGRQHEAAAPLRRAAADPDGPRPLVLGAALAEAALAGGRLGAVLRTIDRVQAEADRQGLTWLARLAHGLIVGLDGTGAARAQSRAFAADRQSDHDAWGSALILTWSALAGLSLGAAEPDAWEELVRRWQALDAAVPAAWARACYAVTAAAQQLPDAGQDARVAEAVARAAGVPGALAYAYAALAATDPEDGGELAALAESSGLETGVDMRPVRAVGLCGGRAPVRLTHARASAVPTPTGPRVVPGTAGTEDRAPELQVRCLGEFRVAVDGSAVDLSGVRPRARSALRMLALHAGRPVHREQLAEALWSELDPRAAMHNLHVSISAVRRALEPQVPTRSSRLVVRDGEAYTLVLRPGSGCDVDELERAVRGSARRRAAQEWDAAADELGRVLDLYGGDLLPEDGPAEWVVGPRARLRLMVADAAADLAQLELDRGRPEQAIAAAARSIELDECRDHAWRLLVAAYTASGDAAAAHRATSGYRAMLDALGIPTVAPVPALAPSADVTAGRGTPPRRSPRTSPVSPGTWS
ncbi:BTAD domain-containing putative transcriptional regulator [Cellulomonas sp.]|uniref:BTAD domain-containing putative transcriptional regulator n=1 Tax=Cellulomonas sp. TaxID=40001 RepID=UPI003BAA7AA3